MNRDISRHKLSQSPRKDPRKARPGDESSESSYRTSVHTKTHRPPSSVTDLLTPTPHTLHSYTSPMYLPHIPYIYILSIHLIHTHHTYTEVIHLIKLYLTHILYTSHICLSVIPKSHISHTTLQTRLMYTADIHNCAQTKYIHLTHTTDKPRTKHE